MSFKLQIYQAGTERQRGEGLRIGVVRYLPRGVKKENFSARNYFDVWLPILAPSRDLLSQLKQKKADGEEWASIWKWFQRGYEREMCQTDSKQTIQLLVQLAAQTPLSLGCYCEDESRCHRSLLYAMILREAGSA